jgi:translation initiation factor 4A
MTNYEQTHETPIDTVTQGSFNDFDDMGLKTPLLRGIYGYGFVKPSVIQQKAIKLVEGSRDLIAQSQSGTGKTGAMTIGLLQKLDPTGGTQFLILAPTRELADQFRKIVLCIGEYMDIQCESFVGGRSVREDIAALKRKPHIVVGTPGRIMHMISEGYLETANLKSLVIDEADEMLSIGFKEVLYEIFKHLPDDIQVILFSATFTDECFEVANKFMRDPLKLLLTKDKITLEGIKQFYIQVNSDEHKYPTLVDLYKSVTLGQTVIFCRSKAKVDSLNDLLTKDGFSVSAIHGDMEQKDRQVLINNFYSGKARVIIATDLLARGIDAHHVSVVINYDLPKEKETYIHRIGRSARFGRKGVAINFLTVKDMRSMEEIESYYNTVVEELPTDFSKFM